EARGLPDAGEDRGIDREPRIRDPVEGESGEAEIADELLDADGGVQQPAPRGARDDEGERQRIEIDRAQRPFDADALVQQNRQQNAQDETDDDEADSEEGKVDDRHMPALLAPEPDIVDEAGPGEDRQHLRAGKGDVGERREEAEAEEQRGLDRGTDQEAGKRVSGTPGQG